MLEAKTNDGTLFTYLHLRVIRSRLSLRERLRFPVIASGKWRHTETVAVNMTACLP